MTIYRYDLIENNFESSKEYLLIQSEEEAIDKFLEVAYESSGLYLSDGTCYRKEDDKDCITWNIAKVAIKLTDSEINQIKEN